MKKKLLLILPVLLMAWNAGAATITSVASGTWTTAANWDLNRVPANGDDVVIAPGHAVTFSSTTQGNLTLASVTIKNGGSLTSASTVAKWVNVIVEQGGVLSLATTTITGDLTVNGLCTFSKALNVKNLIVGSANPSASISLSLGLTVTGTTDILGGQIAFVPTGNSTDSFGGNITIASGALWDEQTTKTRTQTFSGTFTNSGTVKIAVSPISALINTAGSIVSYNGASAQVVPAISYSTLVLGGSGAKTLAAGTAISGNLLIEGAATANITTGGVIPVASLTLGTNVQVFGTYGGSGSGATNIDTTYFTATTAGNYIDVSALSTGDFKAESSVIVYANGGQVYVSNVKSNTTVAVYSVAGALVKTVETSSDTSFDLASGVYVAKVKSAEGEKSVKLLVK